MQSPFLIGECMYLRTDALDDAPRAMAWMNDRELTRTRETAGPITLEQARDWIRGSVPDTQVPLAIACKGVRVGEPVEVVLMSILRHERHARRGR